MSNAAEAAWQEYVAVYGFWNPDCYEATHRGYVSGYLKGLDAGRASTDPAAGVRAERIEPERIKTMRSNADMIISEAKTADVNGLAVSMAVNVVDLLDERESLVQRGVESALEAAAATVCWMCKDNMLTFRDGAGDLRHHYKKLDRVYDCHAAPIRALDVQEIVAAALAEGVRE